MSGGSKKQEKKYGPISGYEFHLGIHMVFCHGPIDYISRIYFGDQIGFGHDPNPLDGSGPRQGLQDSPPFVPDLIPEGSHPGLVPNVPLNEVDPNIVDESQLDNSDEQARREYFATLVQQGMPGQQVDPEAPDFSAMGGRFTGGTIYINRPELFGGEDGLEGGVRGSIELLPGDHEKKSSYLVDKLGDAVTSAYKGVASLITHRMYLGNNPYIRPITAVINRIMKRWDGSPQWYPSRARIPCGAVGNDALMIGFDPSTGGSQGRIMAARAVEYFNGAASLGVENSLGISGGYGVGLFIPRILRMGSLFGIYNGSSFTSITTSNLWGLSGLSGYPAVPERVEEFFADSRNDGKRKIFIFVADMQSEPLAEILIYYANRNLIQDHYYYQVDTSTHRTKADLEAIIDNIMWGDRMDMNGVHIVRECLTNPYWGLAQSEDMIDDDAFEYAADLCFNERFGLSLKWAQESDIESFIQIVLDHLDAILFTDNRTGKWKLVLIRDDYNIEDLPVLTRSDFEVDQFTRREYSESVNSITVVFHDISRNDDQTVSVYNIAAINQLGFINHTTVNYDGILCRPLALKVAERDLMTLGYPILTGTGQVSRKHFNLQPGSVFVLHLPDHGVYEEVMRVLEVNYGDDESTVINIEITSDIYAFAQQPLELSETPPRQPLLPAPEKAEPRMVEELTYWAAAMYTGSGRVDTELDEDPDGGVAYATGGNVTGTHINMKMFTKGASEPDTQYRERDRAQFAPTLFLDQELDRRPDDNVFQVTGPFTDIDVIVPGAVASIGGEMVRIDDYDHQTRTMTVGRGCLDTVPDIHDAGAAIIVWDGFGGIISEPYVAGEEIDVRLVPVSPVRELNLNDADTDTIEFRSRMIRPYPAGNMEIDSTYDYEIPDWTGTFELTWAHRHRVEQTTEYEVEDYTEGNIGPEPGTIYLVRVRYYDITGYTDPTPEAEINVGTDTSYTLDTSLYTPPSLTAQVRAEIVAVRDGYESWTAPFVFHVLPIGPDDLVGVNAAWYDANQPTSVYQDIEGTTPVTADEDPVELIENQKGTLT